MSASDESLSHFRREIDEMKERLRSLDEEIASAIRVGQHPSQEIKVLDIDTPPPLPDTEIPSGKTGTVRPSGQRTDRRRITSESPSKTQTTAQTTKGKERDTPQPGALEMQIGTVWLVRAGVVILVAALVFGSKLAYTHFAMALTVGWKVGFLYAASTLLFGAGVYGERCHLSLKNFSRILSAGGLASLYYLTYAIHHVETLKVVHSPVIAGILLLACALGILAYAVRKGSQSIAVVAVSLAYFASASSPVGLFSLFSNLLLTLVGATFLLRYRWTIVSFVCLAGTYLSFAFWQFAFLPEQALRGDHNIWIQLGSLSCYFLLFAAASIAPSEGTSRGAPRCTFALTNTLLYFTLGSLLMLEQSTIDYAVFPALLGSALTLVSLAPKRGRYPGLTTLVPIHRASGITLITLALAATLSGYSLAIAFAAEAVLLSLLLRRSPAAYSFTGMLVVGHLAQLIALIQHLDFEENGVLLLLVGLAGIVQSHILVDATSKRRKETLRFPVRVACGTIFAGATLLLLVSVYSSTPHLWSGPATIATAGLLALASGWSRSRNPDLFWISLAAVCAGSLVTSLPLLLGGGGGLSQTYPLIAALGILLGLARWTQLHAPVDGSRPRAFAEWLIAFSWAIMLVRAGTALTTYSFDWCLMGGLLAIASFACGTLVKSWRISATAVVFEIFAVACLFLSSPSSVTPLPVSFTPLAMLLAGGLLTHLLSRRQRRNGVGSGTSPLEGNPSRLETVAKLHFVLLGICILVYGIQYLPDQTTLFWTVSAAVVFAVGLALRFRLPRLVALGLIGLVVGHLVIVDVWKLPSGLRVLTLLVAGMTLVGIGFVYNRYQEFFKRFL